jgi:hypothetical protein
MAHLWDGLLAAYDALGLDEAADHDEVFGVSGVGASSRHSRWIFLWLTAQPSARAS